LGHTILSLEPEDTDAPAEDIHNLIVRKEEP
jgi:hypothetical protein